MKSFVLPLLLAACGDNSLLATSDAPMHPHPDAMPDAPIDAAKMVRISGNVDFNGGLAGVTITLVGTGRTTTTDANGDFFFDVPEGSRAIFRAEATSHPELFPMIRGVVAADNLRPRIFYLMGPPDVTSASGLGKTFDSTKATVEIDFRNAEIGGYAATLSSAGTLTPEFGMVYDNNGDPHLGTATVDGGSGSTLLLANLPANDATSFTAVVPQAATLPCQPRDADPLPLVAGAVTWVDYECGTATDL